MAEEVKFPERGEHSDASGAAKAHKPENKPSVAKSFPFSSHWKPIFAFVIYLAVALVMFYPITLHMNTNAPGTGADTYQNLWDIWWVKYAIFNLHTANVFYTRIIFWPLGVNLIYGTLSPLLGVVSAPFQIFGTVFAYNVVFFLGFALSGLTMYILADYLTKNHYAALVSGFVFAFSAFHIAQSYSHIHFMNIEWVPLFIYFFLTVVNEKRKWTNIIGMSASFALTTLMGNIEQTLMLFFAFILLLIIFLLYKETRKNMLKLGFAASMLLFIVLAFIIGSWNFVPLLGSVTSSGGLGIANYLNTKASNIQWSINPGGLFVPSYYNGIVYFSGVSTGIYNQLFAPDPVEKVGYIGYLTLALAIFAVYKRKKEMLPWVAGAIIFVWLALGPNFGLYSVYHALPAINVIREPGRFDLIATLFIAILAAYGSKEIFEMFAQNHKDHKPDRNKAYVILIVLLAIMFVENNGMHIGSSPYKIMNITVPHLYYQLSNFTSNFSVLGLPALPAGQNAYLYPGEDTYYTSIMRKPLVGGYAGRPNLSTDLLLYNIPLVVQTSYLIANGTGAYPSPVLENYTNQTLLTLFNYNTEFVIVHKAAFNQQQLLSLESYLLNVFGNPVYNDNTSVAFSTLDAINRSIFKSFVAYPLLNYWSSANLFLNGAYQTFWVPTVPGSIAVYAPYQSNSLSAINNPYGASYINTTVKFVAFSNTPQKLYIEQPTSKNTTRIIAAFNITGTPATYSATIILASGPLGNLIYLINSNNNVPVLMNNITFSR